MFEDIRSQPIVDELETKFVPTTMDFFYVKQQGNKYSPNRVELNEKMQQIDLVQLFKGAQIMRADNGEITFSFGNVIQSHVLGMWLMNEGNQRQLFVNGLSQHDPWLSDLLTNEDSRIDGDQFSWSEKKSKNGARIETKIQMRYIPISEKDRAEKYSNLIRDFVQTCMPLSTELVADFIFKA